ncbi:tRNA lysidine(34) synthetase TilS [Rhodococcus rhodochrous]|uniref:tRNA(Ile)-lysidine synthase n=1 Tax=Rhodococcus rhodochrous TaxID=1829 RepID=A0AAW4XCD0_RHORH|nr:MULTISPECIES: tRNA lysidine(34) synthetase TilS [Rhodococcus]MCD2110550.1 tRNA lysidine(34) synthetase TilS [Rhodococcus rhodochrous]WAL47001.1 tRNA lysidine(34) synthetase TilS [Rhodococcus pyridinivorans]
MASPSADRPLLPEAPAIHEVRLAVRAWLGAHPTAAVTVALSGGADSAALTAAAVAETDAVHVVVVDHRLQSGSEVVAARAAEFARTRGCATVRVVGVDVTGGGGIEAAARAARYRALDENRDGRPVLLGHTLDDQAETVLLGLGRGSGLRSIRGMAPFDPPWGRPLLGVRRDTTRRACDELGYRPYEDPHNADDRFTRVRLRREVLPLLEDVLGGGVAEALARTAGQLQDDGHALDVWADDLLVTARREDDLLDTDALAAAPAAVRRRALRSWLIDHTATPNETMLRAVDDLVVAWRGQGPVAVGRGPRTGTRLVVSRRRGTLAVEYVDRTRPGRPAAEGREGPRCTRTT